MIRDENPRSALLFTGVRGTGKTSTARIFAAALNCEQAPNGPCADCASCKSVESGTSLDVTEIDGATSGLVDDIRTITNMVQFAVGGEYRVVMIDEAHSMSNSGFNALLKTLEEPPPNTVLILLTTEAGKILDTIVSRCMSFEFTCISIDELVERLEYISNQEGFALEKDLLYHLAERARGGMRDAVMALDQCVVAGVSTVSQFQEMLGESDFGPDFIKACSGRDVPKALEILDGQLNRTGDVSSISSHIVSTLRDVLVLQAGGSLKIPSAARESLAAHLGMDRVYKGLRVLGELRTKVRLGDSPRAMLDLAAVMLVEALAAAPVEIRPQEPRSPDKLSLDQMKRMASS